jgi:hypothetical protein
MYFASALGRTCRQAAIGVAAGSLLAAAAASVAEASKLMRYLETFVGRSEHAAVAVFGPPDETKERTLVWRRHVKYVTTVQSRDFNRGRFATGPGWRQGDCVLAFEVDEHRVVVDVDYSGARHACAEFARNPTRYGQARRP